MSTEENKAIVRRYFEEVQNERKYSVLDEIFSAWDPQGYKQFLGMFHSAFPDFQITIEDQLVEGDKVVTRWTGRGSHLGDWMSPLGTIPATGKQVLLAAIVIDRIENKRIAERWYQGDTLGVLQQLGALPTTEQG